MTKWKKFVFTVCEKCKCARLQLRPPSVVLSLVPGFLHSWGETLKLQHTMIFPWMDYRTDTGHGAPGVEGPPEPRPIISIPVLKVKGPLRFCFVPHCSSVLIRKCWVKWAVFVRKASRNVWDHSLWMRRKRFHRHTGRVHAQAEVMNSFFVFKSQTFRNTYIL